MSVEITDFMFGGRFVLFDFAVGEFWPRIRLRIIFSLPDGTIFFEIWRAVGRRPSLGLRRRRLKLFSDLTLMLPLLEHSETLFEEQKSALQIYDRHVAQWLFIIVSTLLPGRRRRRQFLLASAALFFPLQIGDRRPIAERRPAHLASFFHALGAWRIEPLVERTV
ncbi:MAG: hypothetical protein U1E20_07585 [Methylocystis sp.]|uniref:hypothetical protein n=1 Tax=Methylocystis sp. TaxID=1911079 RepID=UPI00392C040D